jgi:hypothetical protein
LTTITTVALPWAGTAVPERGARLGAGVVGLSAGGRASHPRATARTGAKRTLARRTWCMVRLLLSPGPAQVRLRNGALTDRSSDQPSRILSKESYYLCDKVEAEVCRATVGKPTPATVGKPTPRRWLSVGRWTRSDLPQPVALLLGHRHCSDVSIGRPTLATHNLPASDRSS